MAEGMNDFLNIFFLASGIFRRLPGGGVLKSVNLSMGRIVQYLSGLPFQCSIVYTGQVFLFVTNQLASCVDNTSKLYYSWH